MLHGFEFGEKQRYVEFSVEYDWEPAEPEVGIMSPSFDVTEVEVVSFHGWDRPRTGDSNWEWLDEIVLELIRNDSAMADAIAEAESESAAEEHWERQTERSNY